MAKISRFAYAQMFGPTIGDKVRLADTELFIEVEKDLTTYGEEVKFGGGKVIRDGMGQSQVTRAEGAVDTVITNALIVDAPAIVQGRHRPEGRPHRGDRQGRQSGHAARRRHHHRPRHRGDRRRRQDPHRRRHGRAYPFHLPAADRRGADVRRHHHARRRHRSGARHARDHLHAGPLASRPHDPGVRRLPDEHRPVAARAMPRCPPALEERCWPAPASLKLHEDWGTTPAAIDCCLSVADDYDVQVMIHTDTLNECGFVEDTVAAFKGRTIHAFHTEGAGGGHAPDIIKVCGLPNVIPSSTNPTRPYTVNTLDEHLDMLMVCHHLSPVDPGGRGLRRKPHPQGDDRGRGHPPRPRRLLDHLVRQPGHGPRRRGDRSAPGRPPTR